MVAHSGAKYLPIAYKLSFAGDGSARHTAVLRDIKADSVVEARLDEVREVEPALKCPTARSQPAGGAESENMNKCSGEKNDAQRAK